jgi:hypothetical protein
MEAGLSSAADEKMLKSTEFGTGGDLHTYHTQTCLEEDEQPEEGEAQRRQHRQRQQQQQHNQELQRQNFLPTALDLLLKSIEKVCSFLLSCTPPTLSSPLICAQYHTNQV